MSADSLRAKYASEFDVPDGGRYANDWAPRIDVVLNRLEAQAALLADMGEALWLNIDHRNLECNGDCVTTRNDLLPRFEPLLARLAALTEAHSLEKAPPS